MARVRLGHARAAVSICGALLAAGFSEAESVAVAAASSKGKFLPYYLGKAVAQQSTWDTSSQTSILDEVTNNDDDEGAAQLSRQPAWAGRQPQPAASDTEADPSPVAMATDLAPAQVDLSTPEAGGLTPETPPEDWQSLPPGLPLEEARGPIRLASGAGTWGASEDAEATAASPQPVPASNAAPASETPPTSPQAADAGNTSEIRSQSETSVVAYDWESGSADPVVLVQRTLGVLRAQQGSTEVQLTDAMDRCAAKSKTADVCAHAQEVLMLRGRLRRLEVAVKRVNAMQAEAQEVKLQSEQAVTQKQNATAQAAMLEVKIKTRAQAQALVAKQAEAYQARMQTDEQAQQQWSAKISEETRLQREWGKRRSELVRTSVSVAAKLRGILRSIQFGDEVSARRSRETEKVLQETAARERHAAELEAKAQQLMQEAKGAPPPKAKNGPAATAQPVAQPPTASPPATNAAPRSFLRSGSSHDQVSGGASDDGDGTDDGKEDYADDGSNDSEREPDDGSDESLQNSHAEVAYSGSDDDSSGARNAVQMGHGSSNADEDRAPDVTADGAFSGSAAMEGSSDVGEDLSEVRDDRQATYRASSADGDEPDSDDDSS